MKSEATSLQRYSAGEYELRERDTNSCAVNDATLERMRGGVMTPTALSVWTCSQSFTISVLSFRASQPSFHAVDDAHLQHLQHPLHTAEGRTAVMVV